MKTVARPKSFRPGLWGLICVAALAVRGEPEVHVAGVPNLYLAGDASVAPRKTDASARRIESELRPHLRKNVEIFNYGGFWHSTKTMLEDGEWQRMFKHLDLDDRVVLSFGRVDGSRAATNRCTTAEAYGANLRRMVADLRGKGAKPVLVPPQGKGLESRAACVRAVGAELGVPVVGLDGLRTHPALADLFAERPEPPRLPPVAKDVRERTPEAAAFFRNLKRLGEEGKTVASWLEPWEGEHTYYGVASGVSNLVVDVGDGTYRPAPDDGQKLPDVYVKALTGHDPLVYFLDFNRVTGTFYGREYYSRGRATYEALVKRAYRQYHAVPVFSWHPENPYTPHRYMHEKTYGSGSMYRFRYVSKGYPSEHRFVIREILSDTGGPCGEGRCANMTRYLRHPDTERPADPNPRVWFDRRIAEIADFIGRLVDERGRPIPLVVRLYHECEDDWSWWQRGSVTRDDYVKLFRLTVDEIRRRTGGGRQLLFLYSPDRNWDTLADADSKRDFLYRYPGDEWVDIIGYDDYSIGKPDKDKNGEFRFDRPDLRKFLDERLQLTIEKMRLVTAEARKRGKACGLVETGYRGAVDDGYDFLLRALEAPGVGFSFVNTWGGSTVPPNPEGVACFRRYLDHPRILTSKDGVDLTK